MKKVFIVSLMLNACLFATANMASAQIVGSSTTTDVRVVEITEVALGWSVKKSVLGKPVYNEQGQKIGNVEDLIIATDKQVSYMIIGAGGFVGIGRHDVAIAVSQIRSQYGRLIIPGATKENIKSLPEFAYASDADRRAQYIINAESNLQQAQAEISVLQTRATAETNDAKVALDIKINASQAALTATKIKLDEMKNATSARWKEFEADVNAAARRLHESLVQAAA